MAIRFDIGTLRPAVRGDDGILRADGYLARTGVQVYHNADGSPRREYRPDREVFDENSMRTFALVPVTDDHPPEMITSRNAKKYAVGAVGEQIRKDGDKIAAPIMVYDEDTIRKMQGGKVSLSCGYQCDLVNEPGETANGEKYDAIQTNIRGNHVALVDVARAGREARVRMDAARYGGEDVAYQHLDNLEDQKPSSDSPGLRKKNKSHLDDNRSKQMPKPTTKKDENHQELLEAAADQVSQATKRADEAEAALGAETRRADEAEGELESLRTRVKHLEENRIDEGEISKLRGEIKVLQTRLSSAEKSRVDAESPDRLRKAVKARVSIEKAAEAILQDTSRIDNLSDRELMCVVVEKLHGFIVPAERSDDYVRARFDSAVEQYKRGAEALGTLRNIAAPVPSQRVDAQSARQKMIEDTQNSWKKPLGQANDR